MVVEREPRGAVLVCEDDDDQRTVLADFLREQGYAVYEARHGAEALDVLADADGVKLVLLDLHMPVMDGRTLVDRLRADAAHHGLSLVVCSSEEGSRPPGVIAFLRKPTQLDALLELVRRHCGD